MSDLIGKEDISLIMEGRKGPTGIMPRVPKEEKKEGISTHQNPEVEGRLLLDHVQGSGETQFHYRGGGGGKLPSP